MTSINKASSQDFAKAGATTIPNAALFGVDSYDFLYTVQGTVLQKTKDDISYNFQDYLLGPIASIDLTNPLNIILFYQDTNTVVILDNRLNEKQRIKFNELDPYPILQMALNAGGGRLWLMDMVDQSVWLYDMVNNRIVAKTPPVKGSLITASCRFNNCLIQTDQVLIRVDNFGNLAWSAPSESYDHVVYNQDLILGAKGDDLFLLDPMGPKLLAIDRSENPIKGLQLTQDLLYIYDGVQLLRYTINPSNN